MKLSYDQKTIFKHAFMAGLDLAGTIKRSDVDSALNDAVKRFEMAYKRRFGDKLKSVILLMSDMGSVKTSDLEPYFESKKIVSNLMHELKRKGIVRMMGADRWELNNIEFVG